MTDLGKIAGLPDELGIGSNIARAGLQITIELEKKRFKKFMTIISGLAESGLDLYQLASDLKKKLACGGTVSDKKDILLQGDHRSRIKKVLVGFGFDEANIKLI